MQEHTLRSEHATTVALDQHKVGADGSRPHHGRDQIEQARGLPVRRENRWLGQVGREVLELICKSGLLSSSILAIPAAGTARG